MSRPMTSIDSKVEKLVETVDYITKQAQSDSRVPVERRPEVATRLAQLKANSLDLIDFLKS